MDSRHGIISIGGWKGAEGLRGAENGGIGLRRLVGRYLFTFSLDTVLNSTIYLQVCPADIKE